MGMPRHGGVLVASTWVSLCDGEPSAVALKTSTP